MKVKINTVNKQNDEKIILSIGMIVKNEEKVLGRCLESLKPLMAAISCELIIADTGSTDSTVEIAKRYTDNVFHFEWINDFAAARNSTLEKARGQWFMFLDADEYLDDDIGEMVHFFSIPELCQKYKTLEIMVRSYCNPEKTDYADGCLARFHRLDEDHVRFIGSIHEGIGLRYPLGYFSTILHHTGYCFYSDLQNRNKKERNLALMREEYKKNPDDIRILSHLLDGCAFESLEEEKYIEEALELLKKNRRHLYGNVVYMQAINYYKKISPEYSLELCSDYYKDAGDCSRYVATIAVILHKANILSALARYEEAYKEYINYMKLYRDYKDDKLDITDISAHPVYGLTDYDYDKSIYSAVLCLQKLRRYEEAYSMLEKLDVKELKGEEFRTLLGTLREICKSQKNYKMMAVYYSKIEVLNDKDKLSLALFMLESVYYSLVTTDERHRYAIDVINSGVSGKYIELMNLVIEQGTDGFNDKLLEFVNNVDNWSDGYAEAVYLAVKYKVDISAAVDNMNPKIFRSQLETIANANDDFAGYVFEYGIPESFMTSIKRFYWITSACEKASYRSFSLNDDDRYDLYVRFVSLLGDYVLNIYNPEVLNDDDIDILPPLYQFGYFMSHAQTLLAQGDKIGYVRGMKKALIHCESMKEIIEFLLERFKRSNSA